MDKKKILIVSAVFYPSNSPRANRATELAKEFARQGHEVTVITPRDNAVHPEFEKKYNLTIKDLGQPKWKPIEIKGSGVVNLARRAAMRTTKMLAEYPAIELTGMVKNALKKESGYDLMVSIAVPYPVHWGVAKARKAGHKIADVWVADCGDPFMGSENDTFKHPFYFGYVEKWFCRKADYLAVPTKGSIGGYYPEFRDKIKVISQGFDFNEIALPENNTPNEVPVFAYPGLFIQGRRDPSEMLEYLVSQPKDFRFHIYTKNAALVMPFVKRANGRIILHDFVSRQELLKRLATMDFVVNFENVGTTQTPSKLIDYAIVNKPILSVKTNALDKTAVDEFLNGNYGRQYRIEDVDQYRIENVCSKFLALTR